ncbi:hypothetical protein, partial [Paenibacillus faecis]|uniref:hypothetical protein n=1 Tax=Paenibacillus faecis TaxID=862114 RepID=UPI001BD04DC1
MPEPPAGGRVLFLYVPLAYVHFLAGKPPVISLLKLPQHELPGKMDLRQESGHYFFGFYVKPTFSSFAIEPQSVLGTYIPMLHGFVS